MLRAIQGLLAVAILLPAGSLSQLHAQDTRETVDRELAKPLIRGGIVFKTYCVLCHGEHGDGKSRAAKLYRGVSLKIGGRSPDYFEKIIRLGGEATGVSPLMPPWGDELSNEQVGDVVSYLTVLANPIRRGEVIFKTNCVLCHGVHADGRGRAALLYNPPPADLTRSQRTDAYKEQIIRLGGKAMKRSEVMPIWGKRLTDAEISDLIAFLRSIGPAPQGE